MQLTAREAALTAIERCTREGAWSGASIDNTIKKYGLDRREAALASRICLGVLQNRSYCDFYINCFYNKGADKLEAKLLNILRIGVYQLLFLDKIPARAAVNETVALCKKSGYGRAAGLVNAVLRKVSDAGDNLPEIPGKGSASYLSVRYSHPLWMCEKLIAEHGYSHAEQFFNANNDGAELCIQVNTLKVSAEDYIRELESNGIEYKLHPALDGCISLGGGMVTALPGFDEGLFYVQDKAARTAVAVSGAVAGMNVLDCCSAPGGKSFAAAIAMKNTGAILSCDIHEKKLGLIRSGAERLGIDIISTEARDARADDVNKHELYDLVIADVPCSGLGVIRKKPEIRNKSAEELSGLPDIQRAILDTASAFVKPGGTLLYSTCTVLREENEAVVEAFLSTHNNFSAEEFQLGDIKSVRGMYTFWPHIDNTDGFFVAKLKRIK